MATDAKIAKVERSIERYLRAFESGTMPEAVCGERLNALGGEATLLRARREELAEVLEADAPQSPSPDQLARLRKAAEQTLAKGSLTKRRALLALLVQEIRVHGRDRIDPVFRVPTNGAELDPAKVRTDIGSVGAAGLEPAAFAL